MFTPVPQVMRVRLVGGTDAGNVWGHRIFFQYVGGPPTNATCAAWAQDVYNKWVTRMGPFVSDGGSQAQVVAQDLTTAASASGEYAQLTAGGDSGHPLAADTSIVISGQLARRYRGGKPRTYLGALTVTGQSNSTTITDAHALAVAQAWHNFVLDVNGVAAALGVTSTAAVNVSYRTGGAVRPAPLVEPLIGWDVDIRYGSQRRRMGPLFVDRQIG